MHALENTAIPIFQTLRAHSAGHREVDAPSSSGLAAGIFRHGYNYATVHQKAEPRR